LPAKDVPCPQVAFNIISVGFHYRWDSPAPGAGTDVEALPQIVERYS
jgi:hypothetical protein